MDQTVPCSSQGIFPEKKKRIVISIYNLFVIKIRIDQVLDVVNYYDKDILIERDQYYINIKPKCNICFIKRELYFRF